MWCCFVHCRASDVRKPPARAGLFRGGQVQGRLWPAGCNYGYVTESCAPSRRSASRFTASRLAVKRPSEISRVSCRFTRGDDIHGVPLFASRRARALYSPGLKLCLVTAETLTHKTPGLSQSVHPYRYPACFLRCLFSHSTRLRRAETASSEISRRQTAPV